MGRSRYQRTRAVILAAGAGSRLAGAADMPKAMIRVKGRHIIDMTLAALARAGIREVVVIVGYKQHLLVPVARRACRGLGMRLCVVSNPQYAATNTLYSLWLARRYLAGPFIFLHGDLIFDPALLDAFPVDDPGNWVLVDAQFPLDWDDAMKVICHRSELKYMSKGITVHEMDGTALGIYRFDARGSRALFEVINALVKKGVRRSWVSEAINIMLKTVTVRRRNIRGNPWIDVDNLADLRTADHIVDRIGGG